MTIVWQAPAPFLPTGLCHESIIVKDGDAIKGLDCQELPLQEAGMTDLLFLPCWAKPACACSDIGGYGYREIPILDEFKPYASAFSNREYCDACETEYFDLEVCISPACSLEGESFLDRLHTAEEIARIGLSRGHGPWRADVHYEAYHFKTGLWLPWLQFHYFEPWEEDVSHLSRLANTVIPYLCENALAISEYAWPLRQPHGGS